MHGKIWLGQARHAVIETWSSAETAGVATAIGEVAVERTLVAVVASHATHWKTNRGTWTSGDRRVAAEHCNAGAVLGAAKGHHVLADVSCHNLTALRIGVGENVLNQVVAKLIARNCDRQLVDVLDGHDGKTYCQ